MTSLLPWAGAYCVCVSFATQSPHSDTSPFLLWVCIVAGVPLLGGGVRPQRQPVWGRPSTPPTTVVCPRHGGVHLSRGHRLLRESRAIGGVGVPDQGYTTCRLRSKAFIPRWLWQRAFSTSGELPPAAPLWGGAAPTSWVGSGWGPGASIGFFSRPGNLSAALPTALGFVAGRALHLCLALCKCLDYGVLHVCLAPGNFWGCFSHGRFACVHCLHVPPLGVWLTALLCCVRVSRGFFTSSLPTPASRPLCRALSITYLLTYLHPHTQSC